MKVTFLGVAPGVPTPGRSHSSILIEAGGERHLLDCGEPCSRTLAELGVAPASIRSVLLSHGHADHVGGLPLFIQHCYIARRTEPLDVFLPREIIEPLRLWLKTIYLPESALGFSIVWHAWEDAALHEIAGLSLTTCRTTHLDSTRARQGPEELHRFLPYAIAISAGGKRIVYSGDIGRISDITPLLGEPADLVVCECTHVGEADLAAFFSGYGDLARIMLTHFHPKWIGNEAALEARMRETPGCRVSCARENLQVDL